MGYKISTHLKNGNLCNARLRYGSHREGLNKHTPLSSLPCSQGQIQGHNGHWEKKVFAKRRIKFLHCKLARKLASMARAVFIFHVEHYLLIPIGYQLMYFSDSSSLMQYLWVYMGHISSISVCRFQDRSGLYLDLLGRIPCPSEILNV